MSKRWYRDREIGESPVQTPVLNGPQSRKVNRKSSFPNSLGRSCHRYQGKGYKRSD